MTNSRSVDSNQLGIHDNLDKVVLKHIRSTYQKPIQEHNFRAFECLQNHLDGANYQRLILDSGCGTAMSSLILAQNNPNALIVGVDQSYVRLNKQNMLEVLPQNCLLLRANCEDFWRLCLEQNIVFEEHHILYPNPWPKSVHLKRRWHGHPVFPLLPQLAQMTRLRSNWETYLEEFSRAWQLVTKKRFVVNPVVTEEPLTLFEKKYASSSQVLYELLLSNREEAGWSDKN